MKTSVAGLTAEQRQRYELLKKEIVQDITTGLTAFEQAGRKLLIIKVEALWREEFPNWDAFCREIIGHSRVYAFHLITGYELLQDLAAQGIAVLPDNERVARALAKYPKTDRKMIWQRALQIAGREKPTYKTIGQAAAKELALHPKFHKVMVGQYKSNLKSALKTLRASVDYSFFGKESMQEICELYTEMQKALEEQSVHIMGRIEEIERAEKRLK